MLALVADGVGSAEEERVVEGAVDALGVVASPVEALEVWVAGWDGSDVLGAVELALGVGVGSVESHGDGAAAEVVGELVVVVPAEADLVGVAVGADPTQGVKIGAPVTATVRVPIVPPRANSEMV